MSNSPVFTDSPRASAIYPAPNESPLQIAHAPSSSDSTQLTSSDKLSALPGSAIPASPHRSVRSERNLIPPSASAPSLRVTRPFSVSPDAHDASIADGSSSSHQRVSFEGPDRASPATNHSARASAIVHPLLREAVSNTARGIGSAATGISRSSDPSRLSSAVRLALAGNSDSSPKKPGRETPPPAAASASAAHSRATSPIRLFSWPGFHASGEDAFVPVDPFRIRTRLRGLSFHSPDIQHHLPLDSTCGDYCCCPPFRCKQDDKFLAVLQDARYYVMDTFPRQSYLLLLFRLPSLYFSRIARLYEDAQLSRPDLERMIESYSSSRLQQQQQRVVPSSPIPPGARVHPASSLPFPDEWTTTNASPALVRFKQSWEALVDSLLREWKTLNLVSALLHSAILSMFQNQIMATDPVVRTAALLSLISAMMSLSYGCIYIVRFGAMRSMYKATKWAEEAARTTTFILWNVWVLLAMPAIWLAWSMIFFVVAILAFVWRYGSSTDPTSPPQLGPTAAIGPRVAVSALFVLGLVYLCAIIKTLHNYGRDVDDRLSERMMSAGNRAAAAADANANANANARGQQDRGSRGRAAAGAAQDNDMNRGDGPGRGRDRTRHGREETDPIGLSAVTGLGLRGLDEVAGHSGSPDEVSDEKRRRMEASV